MTIKPSYIASTILSAIALLPLIAGCCSGSRTPIDFTSAEKKTIASDNIHRLGLALLMYVQDYDETFPEAQTAAQIQTAIFPYV